jgi:hypothetical protein
VSYNNAFDRTADSRSLAAAGQRARQASEAMTEPVQIHIRLLDEAVPVWRPVDAEHVGGDQYRVLGPIPEDEVWEFQPGEVVRCHLQSFADNKTGLTAFAAITRDA